MPANQTPIFVLTPNIGFARLAAANTASDGSGTVPTLFTAGANGSRVDSITITNSQATSAASSAMVVKVFITDTSGANPRLLQEIALATTTRSNTAVGQTQTISFANGLVLPSGTLLKVTQTVYAGVQDQVDVVARGGDY